MSARPRALVCDADPRSVRALRVVLRGAGFDVDETGTCQAALARAALRAPDVAIIELVLPDGDGVELCRRLREWSAMPLIVLSAIGDEDQKVRALEAGADDYVTKPFGISELLARIRVALRHAVRSGAVGNVLRLENATVDLDRRTASRDGQPIHLTPIEFRLIAALARHVDKVVMHRQLLAEVWGPTHEGDTHYLRIYMKQLRDKLEKDPVRPKHLITEIGVGYRLVAGDSP